MAPCSRFLSDRTQPRSAFFGTSRGRVESQSRSRPAVPSLRIVRARDDVGKGVRRVRRRERSRGIVLIVVSMIGLASEAISTIQDGIGGPKVIALACFAFLFWYGWEIAHRARPQ